MSFIRLETERLIIRDHTMEDLTSHHELISNKEIMYYLQDIQTETLDQTEANLKQAIDAINDDHRTKYFLRLELKDSHTHIGEIGYTVLHITPVGKIVELGYFIHKEHWAKGYVTEAVREMLRFAFTEDDVYRLTCGCIKLNKGSERIMIKVGMTKEAEFKECEWHDGELKDRVSYRMMKEEWLELGKSKLR